MNRINRDQLGLLLAASWALRGTCARRQVGCVLMDADGYQLGSGYNGPPSGHPHCVDAPCAGATAASGTSLELCEAVHAEANAIMRCVDVRRVHVCYVTHSPCLHCVKLLMNTGCRRIVFAERYAHDEASRALWFRPHGPGRTWEHVSYEWFINDCVAEPYVEALGDLVNLRGEAQAIGGGPGYAERQAKAWRAAEELFEP